MNRLFTIATLALVIGALSCPSTNARGRNNNNNTTTQQTTPSRGNTPARPGNSGVGAKPANAPKPAQATRPGNNMQHTTKPVATPSRPNNNGPAHTQPAQATRPGNTNQSGRPGGNSPGHNRPTPITPSRPGNNFGPGGSVAPAPAPNPGHGYGPGNPYPGWGQPAPGPGPAWRHIPARPPHRPDMMPWRPYTPPVPPAHFRPGASYPVLSTILGVTLGTALNLSLDLLFNNGYYITGYTNDAIYLNDVMQLNMVWPNATMYYNGAGRLVGSEFVYSTPYYDMNRYNRAYNSLVNAYGLPVTTQMLNGGGMQCSWFGYGGQYVTLTYVQGIASDGFSRYYTTLSFGN